MRNWAGWRAFVLATGVLCLAQPSWALHYDLRNRIELREEDGSPAGRPKSLRVTNSTLSDNGDGTFSLSTGATGATISNTAYNSSTWQADTTGGASRAAISNEIEVLRGQDDWQTVGNILFLKTSSDNVNVGGYTNMAKMAVSGDTDEVQILGRGHSTQTNPILTLENSSGTDVFTVANDGTVTSGGTDPFLTLPSGSNPTVNAVGEIAHDTTANQILVALDATTVFAQQSWDTVCYKTYDLSASDDNELMFFNRLSADVVAVGCRMSGDVSTLATIALTDGGGNAMTHTAPTCVSGDATLTFQSVTANNTLLAGEACTYSVTNTPSSTTNEYSICVALAERRQ